MEILSMYLFIALTAGSSFTRNGRVPSMGQIDLFKTYSYSIRPCKQKKIDKKQ